MSRNNPHPGEGVELLFGTQTGRSIASRISDPALGLHAPHLIDVEVAQALRRYVQEGEIADNVAKAALEDLRLLDMERPGHEPLLDRVWTLTAYDAVYVALAEALDARVLTRDGILARAPGIGRLVEFIQS